MYFFFLFVCSELHHTVCACVCVCFHAPSRHFVFLFQRAHTAHSCHPVAMSCKQRYSFNFYLSVLFLNVPPRVRIMQNSCRVKERCLCEFNQIIHFLCVLNQFIMGNVDVWMKTLGTVCRNIYIYGEFTGRVETWIGDVTIKSPECWTDASIVSSSWWL